MDTETKSKSSEDYTREADLKEVVGSILAYLKSIIGLWNSAATAFGYSDGAALFEGILEGVKQLLQLLG